ncbi:MAG: DNA-processing protein DprA [Ignavibacteria bacterium]|nr:DNA-processing protein DprA [Ignavibacteria bacterium]
MKEKTFNNFYFLYSLKRISSLGDVKIKAITENFKSFDEIELSVFRKINIASEAEKIINDIKTGKFSEWYLRLTERCRKEKIGITTILDDDYPVNLKNIYDPPPYLYYKGKLSDNDRYSIGIVGTRYPSDYGRFSCLKIVKELSAMNIPVISGMAMGIDYLAHKKCLEHGNLTYAILGSGVNVIYPKSSKYVYDTIIEQGGSVISEFDIDAKPDKVNFPRRNRIISGISLGVVIIESGIRGGSLITAEFAIDQNRELFAVPGNINSAQSDGCNELLKKNFAKLITNADDIVSEFRYRIPEDFLSSKVEKKLRISELSVFEETILGKLGFELPMHIDEISNQTGINVSDCLVNLLTLEFKGLVNQLPGKNFLRNG